MDRRTKIAVSGILGIAGMFVCSAFSQSRFWLKTHFYRASAAVIVRIPFLHHAKDPDFLRK